MRPKSTVAALVAAVILAAPAVAAAHVDHSLLHAGAAAAYGHDLGHHHRAHKTPTRTHTDGPAANPTLNTTPGHTPQYVEADDQGCTPQNVAQFLQAHDATILRMVLTPVHAQAHDGLACIQAARADGYQIMLSLRYDAGAPNTETAAYVQSTLATYGPVWAASIGNEESVVQDINTASPTPAQYLATWAAAEPAVVAAGTLPVIADAAPWDAGWLEQVMAMHPAGAAAAGFHCYVMGDNGNVGLADVPALATAAQADGYPLWCDEMAPDQVGLLGLPQTVSAYDTDVQQTISQSPNVQLTSWYEWPQIGAVTPGI